MKIKNTLFAAFAALTLSMPTVYAGSLDRGDCLDPSYSGYAQAAKTVAPDFVMADLDANLTMALFEKMGEPPVEKPYTIALSKGTLNGEVVAALVVHDGDCRLLSTPTAPIEVYNRVLGLSDASLAR